MDNRADDSDSGSSRGSWVFVDENEPTDVNAPNQFYLNCLVEPVQELTENDLGVVDCDSDSDSDGISVISETEESLKESSCDDSPQEFFNSGGISDDAREEVEDISDTGVAATVTENGINLKKLFIASSLIGAGVVVVAILIAPYITPPPDTNDVLMDDVGVEMHKKYITSERNVNTHFHCHREHKKRFGVVRFEKTHNESRKHGKHRFDARKGDDRRFSDHVPHTAFKTDDIKHANSVEREAEEEVMIFMRQNQKSKKRNKQSYGCGDEIKSKEEKLKAKEEYLAKKEEYLIMKEYELLKKNVKLQKKLHKYKKTEKKTTKKYYKVEHYISRENKSDGEWYINFNRHREDARRRDHMADWLFERASDRNRRRDDAHWYFQWMIGRQEGRFKRPLRRHNA